MLADISLTGAFSCFFGGSYSLQVTDYLSLPDATKYGKLLGVNPLLVRFPNFVPLFASISTALTALGFTATIVILPQLRPDLRGLSNQLFLGFMLLQNVMLAAMSLFIYNNLINIFERTVSIKEAVLGSTVKKSRLTAIKEREVKYVKVRLFLFHCLSTLILVSATRTASS